MAQLPVIKRFTVEDFPDQAPWIGKLFYQLNLLLNTIYANFNNGITLSQNVLSQVSVLPVKGLTPVVSFPYKYSPAIPIGISVINAVQTNSPAVSPAGAIACTWTIDTGVLTVTVQGLNTAGEYNITFIVWGG